MNKALSTTGTQAVEPRRHWSARLKLVFDEQDKKVYLSRCEHLGPLRVQRLFYPEAGGKAHCYLLHPPGGVATGDELDIQVQVNAGEALLTTPSAGRFYTVGHFVEEQVQRVQLSVGALGRLEWLPQETLLFNGVRARLETSIELAKNAQLAFWDVVVLGRPACEECFTTGSMTQTLAIHREGKLLLRERLALAAGDRVHSSSIGLKGASTVGIFVLTDALDDDAQADWLQRFNGADAWGPFSITQRGELLIARYLGEDAMQCRIGFAQLWRSAYQQSHGSIPATPRIWHT